MADGYDTAKLSVSHAQTQPQIDFAGDQLGSRLTSPVQLNGAWQARFTAGVLPGAVRLRITAGHHRFLQTLFLTPQITDSQSDGMPDFLRLDEAFDQTAFRRWFTFLAEVQYFASAEQRAPEITDCSSLVRYAFREALRNHNAAWVASAKLPLIPSTPSVRKYSFPHTPLGPNIFRVKPGIYRPADLSDGAFAEFADAKTLRELNTFFISRDISRAQTGDVLFYRRRTAHGASYHSMIFIEPSQLTPEEGIYVLYHTGPDGTNNGEIRRLTLNQLLHFPAPEWHPIAANPCFLGVFRWKILKAGT